MKALQSHEGLRDPPASLGGLGWAQFMFCFTQEPFPLAGNYLCAFPALFQAAAPLCSAGEKLFACYRACGASQGSFRLEFSSVSNTLFPFSPPTATVAKVIDRFEDEGTDDILPVGNIRKRASASLLEADKRYSGKATSRKALQEELWGDALSEEGSGKKSHFFSPFLLAEHDVSS